VRRSLLGRLVVRLLAVTLFFIVVCVGALLFQFVEQVETLRDRDLSGQARDIASHLEVAPDGSVSLRLPDPLRDAYDSSNGMFLFAVLDETGAAIFSSRDAVGPIASGPDGLPAPDEPFQVSRAIKGGSAVFYGITVPVTRANETFFIQVAQGPGHSDALADEFLSELLDYAGWLLGVLVVLILGVVYVTVRTSLRPVTEISRQAAAITPATLNARLGVRDLPRELNPLVDAVNNAFERIETAYRQQREFTDNAAHEMRTPLAVLRAHIESLNLADTLLPDVLRLERIVEQLLRLARADNLALADDVRADLNLVATQVAEMLAPDAVRRGVDFELEPSHAPVIVHGDGDYLFIALRNLVENAFNAAGEGGHVRVTVMSPTTIRVSDTGPGIPVADRDRIFERFWRADTASDTGAGLGLSIVRRIVDAHGGTCSINTASGGGSNFDMSLQAAPAALEKTSIL